MEQDPINCLPQMHAVGELEVDTFCLNQEPFRAKLWGWLVVLCCHGKLRTINNTLSPTFSNVLLYSSNTNHSLPQTQAPFSQHQIVVISNGMGNFDTADD